MIDFLKRFLPFSAVVAVAGGNFGGGATYWFKERVGLRFEGRAMTVGRSDLVFVGRIGVSFR